MADYRYERGPIAWPPLDPLELDDPGAEFEDLVARAAIDAPDVGRAIDQAQHDAMPLDGADVDAGDDQDLVDGAIALRAAVASQAELRVTDEIAAIDGIDPEITAGAQDVPPEEDEGQTDTIDERRAPGERTPPGRGGDDGSV